MEEEIFVKSFTFNDYRIPPVIVLLQTIHSIVKHKVAKAKGWDDKKSATTFMDAKFDLKLKS